MRQRITTKVPNTARYYAHRAVQTFRAATWSMRSLPDFIIVGAQKSGTSSLHAYLSQHPQIIPAFTKEVHFFCGGLNPDVDAYARGESWYRTHFPLRGMIGSSQRVFEATPLYMHNPLVAGRIAGLVPEVKLIMLLRNPTERAVSQYFHSRRLGYEDMEIGKALRCEEERLAPFIEKQDYENEMFRRNSYKLRGMYAQQLSRYLKYFCREQILVVPSERFFGRPNEVLKRMFAFVGVDPDFEIPNLAPQNVATNRIDVDPGVYEYLDEFFRLPNAALYDLLGENYGW